jgi:hypothetical protein
MSVADKLLQLNQVKQDIKTAIETKGVPMTNVAFTEYANKILDISGGWDISYEEYALALYYRFGKLAIFPNAWQDSQDSETVLFDIPLALAAPNQEMGGMTIDLYVGTDGQLQALYDACANETIPPPIDSDTRDVYYVNNVATFYAGDISGLVDFPIPIYQFGSFDEFNNTSFLIVDATPLQMGLGLVLAKFATVPIPNNNIVIQQGFEFENENGIIIPDSVTSIEGFAFRYWESNNQPLVIPNSVTSIGNSAFDNWQSNNQPLVIPNSVTSIGEYAFWYWQSNNQPLVIPNSVTSIGNSAFDNWQSNNQPLVIPNSVTSIGEYAFWYWQSNNQPLVIPDSVTSISNGAFGYWESNNQPLVIPNSVTSIGDWAFYYWSSNNQPLVIPDSVTSISNGAFGYWESNNQPLVIPESVTSIGDFAFTYWSLVPYVEIQAITPPTLASNNAFTDQNNAPIYVPDESVDDYKTATNWVNLANRIFSINDK